MQNAKRFSSLALKGLVKADFVEHVCPFSVPGKTQQTKGGEYPGEINGTNTGTEDKNTQS